MPLHEDEPLLEEFLDECIITYQSYSYVYTQRNCPLNATNRVMLTCISPFICVLLIEI